MLGLRRVQLLQACRAQTSLAEQLRCYAASEQGKQPDEAKVRPFLCRSYFAPVCMII
jgi:hypothetical protein